MIVWRGLGFLVGVIGFGSLILAEFVAESITKDEQFYQENPWVILAGFTVAAVLTFGLYKLLRLKKPRIVIDKETREEFELGGNHSFFFIPVKWWPVAFIALGLLFQMEGLTDEPGTTENEPATPTQPMSEESTWNDTSRSDLRDSIRHTILGEVRLGRFTHDDLIDYCREVYIEDECPEDEWPTFVSFAEDHLKEAAAAITKEQAEWPAVTDCDRLDRAEAALREKGILLWQVSPCCDTCTGAELPDRIDEIEKLSPGFREKARGYAFFIDQNMAELLADDAAISVYLAYGWFSPEDSEVSPEEYEEKALGIAREVLNSLHEQDLKTDWDGSFSKKIGLQLHWQRRTIVQ